MTPRKPQTDSVLLAQTRLESLALARAGRGRHPKPGHTVRTADGGTRYFAKWPRGLAVKAFCVECMGFGDPADCTSPLCPLFPYRARTRATAKGGK